MLVKALVLAALAMLFYPPLRTFVWYMDWYGHSYTHHPGKCRAIKASGIGYEDVQILSSGLTFISSGLMVTISPPKFKTYAKSKGRGSIQMIDLNGDSSETEVLRFKHGSDFKPETFRPHGLSILDDPVKGEHLIYVVNHVENQADRIEKFRFLPQTKELLHEKSIFSDEFHILNDLTVVEEDVFYTTDNYFFNTSNTMCLLEQLYMVKLASVFFYNGTHAVKATGRLFGPNGIILSQNKRHVYVSLLNTKTIHVYERREDNQLKLVQVFDTQAGVDNFHLSEDGSSLYGGCHPVMHKAVSHLMDPAKEKAPSQVIRMPLRDGLIVEQRITNEFYDQGDLISGSSVAGVYGNKMIIGSAVDVLVICKLPRQLPDEE